MSKNRAFVAIGIFAMMVSMLITSVIIIAVNDDLYFRVQKSVGVDAGVSDSEMRRLDATITATLCGGASLMADETVFSDNELTHMIDVVNLFRGLGIAAMILTITGAAFCLLGLVPKGRRYRRIYKGSLYASIAFIIVFGVLAIYVSLDFDRAFTQMHELLFSNDLWLLDPDTDMLLMLMPEEFFIRLAVIAVSLGVILAAVIPSVMCVIAKITHNLARSRHDVRV